MTLYHYLTQRVALSSLFTSFILVGLVWLLQSLRFIEIIVNHNISFLEYFTLTICLIPDTLAAVLPIGFFIGLTFTFYRLSVEHELIVIEALGVSRQQLLKPLSILSGGIALSIILLNIFISPIAFKTFRDHEHFIRNQFSDGSIKPSTFNTFRGTTIYYDVRDAQGGLQNILIHQKNETCDTTIIARRGEIKRDGDKPFLFLENGQRQEKDIKTNQVSFFEFAQFSYDLSFYMSEVQARSIKPYEMPLGDLLFPSTIFDTRMQTKMKIEGHQRLMNPLLVIVDVFLVCLFLGYARSTRTRRRQPYLQLISIALILHVLPFVLINSANKNVIFIAIAYMCVLIIFTVSAFQIWKKSKI